MTDASNSDNGIGLSQNDAASHISSLLDSNLDIATTDEPSDVENETDEVSTPSDDEIELSDEQSLEDSDETVDAEEDEAATAEAAPIKIADDLVFEIDGETITGKQWKEANLRYADYTRKTQELAEARKGVDVQVNSIRDQSLQWFQNMERDIAMYLPQEPNWAQLATDDPAEYVAQKEKWAGIHAQIGRLRQERALVEQQQAQIQEAQLQRDLAEGQKRLWEMHPELAKPETGKAKALGDYLVNAGIPAEAIGRETNPVLFSIAFKAMQFDQLQAQKAKAVKVVDAKPPLTTPGSSPARSNSSQSVVERKMSALKRTGSQAAAADVLKHLL
ncbi:hypothetical protein [Rhizobium sp. 2MFCol3.1]|uniref:hypothetical protein n=1 Tax=Rhizobium sp. 2MFCol3.1 TaxID=1246459 RepID=UPI000380DA45|nr:hypothetical protein [Rhizobium sp. 2MFCol3.1]